MGVHNLGIFDNFDDEQVKEGDLNLKAIHCSDVLYVRVPKYMWLTQITHFRFGFRLLGQAIKHFLQASKLEKKKKSGI